MESMNSSSFSLSDSNKGRGFLFLLLKSMSICDVCIEKRLDLSG